MRQRGTVLELDDGDEVLLLERYFADKRTLHIPLIPEGCPRPVTCAFVVFSQAVLPLFESRECI